MKIYTSYFAKAKALTDLGIVPIGISLYNPKFFNGPAIRFLAPTRDMLSDSITTQQYIDKYKDICDKIDMSLFRTLCTQFSQGKDIALCCYERPEDFCHRHLFADWVKEKFGYEIEEYVFQEPTPKIKKEKPKPLSLFDE